MMKSFAILAPAAALIVTLTARAQEDEAGAEGEPQEEEEVAALSYVEVMEEMKNPSLRADIETCVETWLHPDEISLRFMIQPDGSVKLESVDPAPPKEVALCIAGAVSMLDFRATGAVTPVTFAYDLPPQPDIDESAAPPAAKAEEAPTVKEPPTAVEPFQKFPGGKRAGFGVFGAFLVLNRGYAGAGVGDDGGDAVWYGKFSGGVGVFGEFLLTPQAALGLELGLLFPTVEDIQRKGEAQLDCADCELGFLYEVLVRAKFPIRIIPQASFYPIALAGHTGYIHRVKGEDPAFYPGIGIGGGVGLEDYTSVATLFFEVRYLLHAGWTGGSKTRLLDHNVTIDLGARFP
jgi:hypothetical protein